MGGNRPFALRSENMYAIMLRDVVLCVLHFFFAGISNAKSRIKATIIETGNYKQYC